MSYWQYLQGMALEFKKKKKLTIFFLFFYFYFFLLSKFRAAINSFSVVIKVLGNKIASLYYLWVSIDAGTYFGIIK